uniref:BPTI/Kunitz inhibitor domain-containing protein n=1 Tax=Ditylenchus dipsaci TaxID=166011 RepID=A0A915EQH6_9BILA
MNSSYISSGSGRSATIYRLRRSFARGSAAWQIVQCFLQSQSARTTQECNTAKNCTEIGFECIDGSYCCPTKENVCTSAEDSGRERMQDEHFGRYAYSAQLKTCVKFSYFGNEGNFNNFLKHRDCMHYCHSQAN